MQRLEHPTVRAANDLLRAFVQTPEPFVFEANPGTETTSGAYLKLTIPDSPEELKAAYVTVLDELKGEGVELKYVQEEGTPEYVVISQDEAAKITYEMKNKIIKKNTLELQSFCSFIEEIIGMSSSIKQLWDNDIDMCFPLEPKEIPEKLKEQLEKNGIHARLDLSTRRFTSSNSHITFKLDVWILVIEQPCQANKKFKSKDAKNIKNQFLKVILGPSREIANQLLEAFVDDQIPKEKEFKFRIKTESESIHSLPYLRLYIPNKPLEVRNCYKEFLKKLSEQDIRFEYVRKGDFNVVIIQAKEFCMAKEKFSQIILERNKAKYEMIFSEQKNDFRELYNSQNKKFELDFSKNKEFASFHDKKMGYRYSGLDSNWKIHINIHSTDLSKAWNLIYPILERHALSFTIVNQKFVEGILEEYRLYLDQPQLSQEERAKQTVIYKSYQRISKGGQITIKIPPGQEKEYENFLIKIEKILLAHFIRPGEPGIDHPLGQFCSVRHPGKKQESAVTAKSFNPDNLPVPFDDLPTKPGVEPKGVLATDVKDGYDGDLFGNKLPAPSLFAAEQKNAVGTEKRKTEKPKTTAYPETELTPISKKDGAATTDAPPKPQTTDAPPKPITHAHPKPFGR